MTYQAPQGSFGPDNPPDAGIPNQQYPGGYPPPYPPPPYPGPGYGQYYAYPPPASARTNTMAILALILAFVVAPAGIVLGIIAIRQIRTSREDGHGLAVAGIVVGSIFTALGIVYILLIIVFFAALANSGQNNSDMLILLSNLLPVR
jgi:hypothetical protein